MDANIRITDDEIRVIENSDFFIAKNKVSTKIKLLFGLLRDVLKQEIEKHPDLFPAEIYIETGRVFQGENYKLFPYILLDYPKLFSTTSVLTFRTMFWWGHCFSFTLHLEGNSLDLFRGNLVKNSQELYGKGFYFCIHQSPWQYHFDEDNYLPIEQISELETQIKTRKFVKLSRKLDLRQWPEIQPFALDSFKFLLKILE